MQASSSHRWLGFLLCSFMLLQALWGNVDTHSLIDDHSASADVHHIDMLHEHGHLASHQHDHASDDETDSEQHCCHANHASAAPLLTVNTVISADYSSQHVAFPATRYHNPLKDALYRPPIA